MYFLVTTHCLYCTRALNYLALTHACLRFVNCERLFVMYYATMYLKSTQSYSMSDFASLFYLHKPSLAPNNKYETTVLHQTNHRSLYSVFRVRP